MSRERKMRSHPHVPDINYFSSQARFFVQFLNILKSFEMQDELRCRKHNFIFMFMNLVLNMRCSIFDLSLAFVKLTYGQILFSAV